MNTDSNEMMMVVDPTTTANKEAAAVIDLEEIKLEKEDDSLDKTAQTIACDSSEQKKKTESKLTFWEIVAIQASYSAAANIFQIPSMIGTWGYVLGPIVFALWFGLVYFVAAFVCDVVTASKGRCKHYSGVGYELAGNWGSTIFRCVQLVNLILYIPTIVDSAQEALKTIFGPDALGGCDGYWKLIVVGILFVMMQVVKNFKEASWLAYASLAMAFLQACVFAPLILVNTRDEYPTMMSIDSGELLDMGPAQPFLYPDADWWTVLKSFLPYGFTGTFLIAETMSVAENPDQYKKALSYSMGIMYVLYMVPALLAVLLWGRNIDFLLNTDFGQGALSIVIQLFVFFPNLLDFLLSCLVVNDAFRRRFIYKNGEEPEANPPAFRQLLITLPTLVFAFVAATFVPNIETLVGVSASLALVPGITWMISAAWFAGRYWVRKSDSDNREVVKSSVVLQSISLIAGLFVSVVFFVSFVLDFIDADWSLNGVFCG